MIGAIRRSFKYKLVEIRYRFLLFRWRKIYPPLLNFFFGPLSPEDINEFAAKSEQFWWGPHWKGRFTGNHYDPRFYTPWYLLFSLLVFSALYFPLALALSFSPFLHYVYFLTFAFFFFLLHWWSDRIFADPSATIRVFIFPQMVLEFCQLFCVALLFTASAGVIVYLFSVWEGISMTRLRGFFYNYNVHTVYARIVTNHRPVWQSNVWFFWLLLYCGRWYVYEDTIDDDEVTDESRAFREELLHDEEEAVVYYEEYERDWEDVPADEQDLLGPILQQEAGDLFRGEYSPGFTAMDRFGFGYLKLVLPSYHFFAPFGFPQTLSLQFRDPDWDILPEYYEEEATRDVYVLQTGIQFEGEYERLSSTDEWNHPDDPFIRHTMMWKNSEEALWGDFRRGMKYLVDWKLYCMFSRPAMKHVAGYYLKSYRYDEFSLDAEADTYWYGFPETEGYGEFSARRWRDWKKIYEGRRGWYPGHFVRGKRQLEIYDISLDTTAFEWWQGSKALRLKKRKLRR